MCRLNKIGLRKQNTFFVAVLIIVLLPFYSIAQTCIIKGKLTDQQTHQPISFANIGVKDNILGTVTDIDGNYQLELQKGTYTIFFSSIEYEKVSVEVSIGEETSKTLDIAMKLTAYDLKLTVITDSKYEQRFEESVSSIEVIKPSFIENKNATSMDKALEFVPGLTIVDNEPQIRGSSGFSSGLGSRVMIMVDGIPMMQGDAGRPVWNFLPIESVEQVEVVKGASSVIYGSSALNGAINVRTAYPKDKSHTKITLHTGIYSAPSRKYAKTWSGFNPMIAGGSFIHSQQIDNFDLVLGGNIYKDEGYIGPVKDDTNNLMVNKGCYEQWTRFNFGTRIRSKKIKNLSYGLNGNFMSAKSAQAFYWDDADTNIYRPYPGALTNFKNKYFYLDPYFSYYSSNGASHTFKNRWSYTSGDADNDQSTKSNVIFNEYQFSKKFKTLNNLILTAGMMNMYITSTGKVFSGHLGEEGTSTSDNFAIYTQIEKKLFNRVTFLIGGRWEYYKINEHSESKPVFRVGANTQISGKTYLRASFGQGYRFPSIGERYITTNVGNFGFYPNPDLKSESSWNTEIGIKKLYRINSFSGYFDACVFWEEYHNYVEFNASLWGTDTLFSNNLGFKFLNTGKARVRGFDGSIAGEGNIFRNVNLGFLAGYTYSLPQSLDPNGVYYVNTNRTPADSLTYIKSSSDTTNHILKYRIQHLAKLDINIGWKNFTFGISGKFYSFMKNMDKFFYNFDRPGMMNTGIVKYREEHNNPNIIWDARISFGLRNHLTFSLIMNNIFNTEYSLRPITIEPTRVTSLQIIYKI